MGKQIDDAPAGAANDAHGTAFNADPLTTTTTNNTDEPPPAVAYEPQRARADIREHVRGFIKTLEDLRDTAITYEGKTVDAIDVTLRYETLNQYRLTVLGLAIGAPILAVSMLLVSDLFHDQMQSMDMMDTVADPVILNILGVGALLLGLLLAFFRLSIGLKDNKTATNLRLHDIEQTITNQFAELQKDFSAAQNHFKVEISPNQIETPYKEAIIGMFRFWRELERLPIYLRHDFDEYFNKMNDTRQLGGGKAVRILTFTALFLLAVYAVSIAVCAHLAPGEGGYWLFQDQADLSKALLIVMAGVAGMFLLFIRIPMRDSMTRFVSVAGVSLGVVLIVIVGFGLAENSNAQAALGMTTIAMASTYIAITLVMGVIFLFIAGEVYKQFADHLIVNLVRALKTHKKEYAIQLTRHGFKDWLKDTQGSGNDWNGWTPGYEDRRRQTLIQSGSTPHDAQVEAACDPVVYVGNEKNRRLQAAGTDLVSAFYKKLPVVRQ